MGLPTETREALKKRYSKAFSFSIGNDRPTVAIYDLMMDVKFAPDNVKTINDMITYLTNKIMTILRSREYAIREIVVAVDRAPVPVKKMIAHKKRYKSKQILEANCGAHLDANPNSAIPSPWIGFAGNFHLLQRELYPRLFNAFMMMTPPYPGQTIYLHGFPGTTKWVTTYQQNAFALGTSPYGEIEEVQLWNTQYDLPITEDMEKKDPNLYQRIYMIQHTEQGQLLRNEWKEAKNDIAEVDSAMFYYDHWFQNQTILLLCNDGDIFSYGLLYSYERVTPQNAFRNKHIGCLKYKKKKGDIFPPDEVPKWEYIDFNELYVLVKEDPQMRAAGVQNPIVTLVFIIIMTGTDFFEQYMQGVGVKDHIWKPFFEHIELFTHLVQSSNGVLGSTRTAREIILDEDLFRIFVYFCYQHKYNKDASYEELKLLCSKRKKEEEHLPDRNTVRLWARQVEWNLLYYKNSPFGKPPDPFEKLGDLPYFPYINDAEKGPIQVDAVAPRRKHIDEVYLQHMWKRRVVKEEEIEQRKKKACNEFNV